MVAFEEGGAVAVVSVVPVAAEDIDDEDIVFDID